MTCIVGLQYLPPVEFFAHWMHHDSVCIEGHEHYQKRSWRNRTAILSSSHPTALTVPLLRGKHQQMPIIDVGIAYHEPWMNNHIHAIQSVYGKTAFADEVLPIVFDCITLQHPTLWSLNESLLKVILSLLEGQWDYMISDTYRHQYADDVVDLRQGIPVGITTLTKSAVPIYAQVQRLHQPFQANLTILDVLCHLGPDSVDYISRYAAHLYATT